MASEPRPLEPDEIVYVRARVIAPNGFADCPAWCAATMETVGRNGKPGEASSLIDIRDRSHVLTTDELERALASRR